MQSSDVSATGEPATSDDTSAATAQKAVTIYDEPALIPSDETYSAPKVHRASIGGKKMTGRSALARESSSLSLTRTISHSKSEEPVFPFGSVDSNTASDDGHKLYSQVLDWLNEEKAKRISKPDSVPPLAQSDMTTPVTAPSHTGYDNEANLERLEKILNRFALATSTPVLSEYKWKKSRSASSSKRGSIAAVFKRSGPPASSDTEWVGEDVNVPHAEAFLDNTRTLAFTGGSAEIDDIEAAQQKDMKYWDQFKQDIVRLAHTLRIRGWRRIPIDNGQVISVERLSGALTNAVYVVKPPKELPEPDRSNDSGPSLTRSKPKELLLRIYGPQVEHLFDRDAELQILRRLARKKIGPRLLGYFTNGRFEEYLHAKNLDAHDIHVKETSRQIAKRMRELHDGIELLPSERESGARTFINWDKWVDRCEKVITWLDLQVKLESEGHEPPSKRYTRRGLICGVEWPMFRKTYDKYRKILIAECGGEMAIRRRLVFAHNDAQYGNLMRVDPPGESPLLQPANQHRQLVVIDFEYAGPNTPGYEFVNHFSEWCYNYHDAGKSYACNANAYPTRQEQYNFVRAYVMHRPQFNPSASASPRVEGREKTNISNFMLDARAPPGAATIDYDKEERDREAKQESDIQLLLRETRLWRIANAAQWVAWGIVQAKVPELDDPPRKSKTARVTAALDRIREHIHPRSDTLDEDVKALSDASKHDRPEGRQQEEAHAEGDDDGDKQKEIEEFDYLAYAQDRAMLFWGDCIQMGIVEKDALPESLLNQVKTVNY